MRNGTVILLVVAAAVAMAAVWLLLGSRMLLLFDALFPGTPTAQNATPLLLRSEDFVLGDHRWPAPDGGAFHLILDSHQRLVLSTDGRHFTFGPVTTRWNDPRQPQYLFISDSGDQVTFTRDASRLSWQTPFAFSIMGGSMPKWHRYAYDRLRWIKTSGAMLQITWRQEQVAYTHGSEWFDQNDHRVITFEIRPSAVEKAAAAYLLSSKGWKSSDYRLEPAGDSVAAIYGHDESAHAPGAGKSVVLRIDRASLKVLGESGFQ